MGFAKMGGIMFCGLDARSGRSQARRCGAMHGAALRIARCVLAGLLLVVSSWVFSVPAPAYAESAPPTPKLLASYNLGGGYSDYVTLECLSKDGRFAVVSSTSDDYEMTYVVNLDTGETRRLPDVEGGYDFSALDGSRAVAYTRDAVYTCDLSTTELEPLAALNQYDEQEHPITSVSPTQDGRALRAIAVGESDTHYALVYDISSDTITKEVEVEGYQVLISDDLERVYTFWSPDSSSDDDYEFRTYRFESEDPVSAVNFANLPENLPVPPILVGEIDENSLLTIAFVNYAYSLCRMDCATGTFDALFDTAVAGNMSSYGGDYTCAAVDPFTPAGYNLSYDSLGRIELQTVDIATGELRYQCQLPLRFEDTDLVGYAMTDASLSNDGRYLFVPIDRNDALSEVAVVDVSTGATSSAPWEGASDAEVEAAYLTPDDGKLVILTVDHADGSMNMALAVYDTGLGGSFLSFMGNMPVLIIVVVALVLFALVVVGLLIFMGRRRRVPAAGVAGANRGPIATAQAASQTPAQTQAPIAQAPNAPAQAPAPAPASAQASAVSFCPQCGRRVEASDAAFCPHCGTSLRR